MSRNDVLRKLVLEDKQRRYSLAVCDALNEARIMGIVRGGNSHVRMEWRGLADECREKILKDGIELDVISEVLHERDAASPDHMQMMVVVVDFVLRGLHLDPNCTLVPINGDQNKR